jgi:hypothetical protein
MASSADNRHITLFWSWQLDSPSKVNRDFVEDCLERAVKKIAKADALIVKVDRDTQGVSGTPAIAETILQKIRAADVFVWDATLAYRDPRPAPNPNVLVEFGYALAILGESRLIGVMNTAGGPGPEELPFDLKHRRWPLRYALRPPGRLLVLLGWGRKGFNARRAAAREGLVAELETAMRAALSSPRVAAIRSDVDLLAARNLWTVLNTRWLHDWHEARGTYPQYEEKATLRVFSEYHRLADHPENIFADETLRERHGRVVSAIKQYLATTGVQMVPDKGNSDVYVISTKGLDEWVPDYDERYDKQVNHILEAADAVWEAWTGYVEELRRRYPEITAATVE